MTVQIKALPIKGKAKAGAHHHVDTHTNAGVPVISIDYAFICDTDEEARALADVEEGEPQVGRQHLRPLLVVLDGRTKGIYAQNPEFLRGEGLQD